MNSEKNSSRRDLLKLASLGTLAAGVAEAADSPPRAASVAGVKFEAKDTVRLGVIGVGGRGNSLIDNFSPIPQVRITAICDVVKDKVDKAQARLEKAGKQAPALYHSSERAYEQLVTRDDIDLLVIATPWVWHVPMAVAGMKAGKHVAVEAPAARSIEDCWALVDTSEKTRRHCVQLENCCYGENELMVLLMVRAGLFGDLTHGACAYNHDLRSILFSNEGEGLWRRFENVQRNGNIYPTHGLGPVAHYMDINRGDRFDYMVSMSSLSASLQAYRQEKVPAGDPRQKEVYRNGDLNISLIRTAKGRLIELEHNVAEPQPYDRINMIAGTKGIFRDYPPRIYVEGSRREEFGPLDPYRSEERRVGKECRSRW